MRATITTAAKNRCGSEWEKEKATGKRDRRKKKRRRHLEGGRENIEP
jgi:hypothetical protein